MYPVMIEIQEMHSGTVGFINFAHVRSVIWHEDGASVRMCDERQPIMVRQSPTQLFSAVERKIAAQIALGARHDG